MKIVMPDDYPIDDGVSEWVVLLQELVVGTSAYKEYLADDPDQIIELGGRKYGMRAILYVDKEHVIVQGWELTNIVYDRNGEERESGREIRSELLKVIHDGTWDQELTYGDLGIGFHNFTVMEDLEEDWIDLPTKKYVFRLLVPEIKLNHNLFFQDSINYLTVPR